MSETSISIKHVRVSVDRPFDAFRAAFERQLGRFDPSAYKELDSGEFQAVRTRLESMAGPSGLMLFYTSDHGALLRLVGKPRKAMQYLLGNPLIAIEMTAHAIGAALYAPLRVLIYEAEGGETRVEYDLPSSLFGQFENKHVDWVAESLDKKLDALVAAAAR
jgi:uncharacterized protein (DUF302 family)